MLRIGKFIKTGSLLVAKGWGEGDFHLGWLNVLELVVVIAQPCDYTKSIELYILKMVLLLCEFCLKNF